MRLLFAEEEKKKKKKWEGMLAIGKTAGDKSGKQKEVVGCSEKKRIMPMHDRFCFLFNQYREVKDFFFSQDVNIRAKPHNVTRK